VVRPVRRIRSLNWTTSHWNEEVDGPQVELYAIGVSPDVDVAELNVIASPLPHHVLLMKNVETFELFSRDLHSGLRESLLFTIMVAKTNKNAEENSEKREDKII